MYNIAKYFKKLQRHDKKLIKKNQKKYLTTESNILSTQVIQRKDDGENIKSEIGTIVRIIA